MTSLKKDNDISGHLDILADLIIDMFLSHQNKRNYPKGDIVKASSKHVGIFNGRPGQVLTDLSSPGRPFKLNERLNYHKIQ